MLVVLPMGLWIFSLVADVIAAAGWSSPWTEVAFYTIAGGVVGAVLAAVPGLIDFLSIRDQKSRSIGAYHMIVNLAATAIFAVNLYLRAAGHGGSLPLILSVIAIALIGVGGWLGGELVYVHGVGVEPATPRRNTAELREVPRKKISRTM